MSVACGIDPACPIDWSHPLNVGLYADYSVGPLPGWSGGRKVRDLVRGGKCPHDGDYVLNPKIVASAPTPGFRAHSYTHASGTDLIDFGSAWTPSNFPISFGGWIWLDTLNAGAWMGIKNGGNYDGFLAFQNSSKYAYSVYGSGSSGAELSSTTSTATGVWRHVFFVSAANNDHRIYINGEQEATSTSTVNSFTVNKVTLGTMYVNGLPWYQDFYGRTAGFRIYSRGLQKGHVRELIRQQRTESSELYRWLRPWSFGVEVAGGSDITIGLSPLSALGSLIAPLITVGTTLAPPVLAGAGTLVAPAAATDVSVAPAPVVGAGSVAQPSATTGATVEAGPQTGAGTVVAPTTTTGVAVAPDPLSGTGTVVAPTAATGTVVTPDATAAIGTVVAPSATIGTILASSPVNGAGTLVAPDLAGSVAVTPDPLEGIAALTSPIVVTGTTITIGGYGVFGTPISPTMAVGTNFTIGGVPASGVLVAPSATIGTILSPTPLSGTGTTLPPEVSAVYVVGLSPLSGSGSPVAPAVATANLLTVSPLTSYGIPIGPVVAGGIVNIPPEDGATLRFTFAVSVTLDFPYTDSTTLNFPYTDSTALNFE